MILATSTQLATLRAFLDNGGVKQAAHSLGTSPSTVKHRLQALRDRNRMTTGQLARELGRMEGSDQLDLRLVA